MTKRRMRIACWIPKATTHTQNEQYLLLLHCNNGNTKLRYKYIVFVVKFLINDDDNHRDIVFRNMKSRGLLYRYSAFETDESI